MENVQYVTDEQGSQVGVILSIDTYRKLIRKSEMDPELLAELNSNELQALADSQLTATEQERLDVLLARNNRNELTDEETVELDRLIQQVDQLNLLKTRARYTLRQLAVMP